MIYWKKSFAIMSKKIRQLMPLLSRGLKSVNNSFDNPLLYWDVNVEGSLALFNAMIKWCFKLVSVAATVQSCFIFFEI